MERRLGRGLSSLLSSSQTAASKADAPARPASSAPPGPARWLPIGQLHPNPFQPRKHFDEDALAELRDSLATHGMLQPVVVRPSGDGFELIAGERRWRAAKLAGLEAVPAVVKDEVSDAQMLEWAMVENLQRRDLDPIERARGYRTMLDELKLTQEQVAERVGLRRSTVTNHLRLLDLGPTPQALLREGTLSMGHARALLGLEDRRGQDRLARDVVAGGLSVREVERRVRELQQPRSGRASGTSSSKTTLTPQAAPKRSVAPWAKDLERRLLEKYGTRVEIQDRGGYRGTIAVHYADREDLDRLIEALLG